LPDHCTKLSGGLVGGPSCSRTDLFDAFIARFLCGGTSFAFVSYIFQLFISEMFYTNEGISRGTGADKLIELCLNGGAVPVLVVLDQEHHQKGDDGRAGVDHQLLRV